MKKNASEYFELFMFRNGADQLFRSLYKEYKFSGNTETYEEWVLLVKPVFAIALAFDYNKLASDSQFNREFWEDLHYKWVHHLSQWSKGDMQTAEGLIEYNLSNVSQPSELKPEKEVKLSENTGWFGDFLAPLDTGRPTYNSTPVGNNVRFTCGKGLFVFSAAITRDISSIKDPKVSLLVDKSNGMLYLRFASDGAHNVRTNYSTELYAVQSKSFTDIMAKYLNTTDREEVNIYVETGNIRWSNDKTACLLKITRKFEIK